MIQALLDIDDYHSRMLTEQTRPGESRDTAIARLLIDQLDGAAAANTRMEIVEQAREFSAALTRAGGDAEAQAWAAALAWFASRIRGGHLSIHAHHAFVERFGVDPGAREVSEPDEARQP